MTRLEVRWFLLCEVVGLLAACGSITKADLIIPDPNALAPGELYYRIVFDSSGQMTLGEGWGYGNRWYYYPSVVLDDENPSLPHGVYRQWYYRGPYKPQAAGSMAIAAGLQSLDDTKQYWYDVHFIRTTPQWSALALDRPPLPEDGKESTYIDRSLFYYSQGWNFGGSAEPLKGYLFTDYSPEWVGIEIAGANLNAVRWVAPQGVDMSDDLYPPNPVMDFGDAPDSYGTLLASNGARHVIAKGVYLGQGVDFETDAVPSYDANSDDDHGDQDDDGVVFLQPLAPGCATGVDVTASTAGYLNAWFDYDHDGTFNGANEHVFSNVALVKGVNHLSLMIPASAATGTTFARFRFNLSGGLDPVGQADDGEVEDYKVILAGDCGSSGGEVVLRDGFDDNAIGRQWYLDQADSSNLWLEEVNKRLELRSNTSATGTRAQYVSSYWRLAVGEAFSLKANYSFSAITTPGAWLSIRLSPSSSSGATSHMDFDVGCESNTRRFRFEVVNSGATIQQGSLARSTDTGTLYISYDPDTDELYLSPTGAGQANAWQTISGVLKGRWGGAALNVAIGGTSSGAALNSAQAWLDEFTIQSGTLKGATALNRFWSSTAGQHFYTMSDSERRKLIDKYARSVWNCEGVSYYAFAYADESGTLPVYRFWCRATGEHFFTISESERNKLLTQLASVYTDEGIAFYAYPASDSPTNGAKPVYRFWSPKSGEHFYTISAAEKEKIITKYSESVWKYEGIAWCAYE